LAFSASNSSRIRDLLELSSALTYTMRERNCLPVFPLNYVGAQLSAHLNNEKNLSALYFMYIWPLKLTTLDDKGDPRTQKCPYHAHTHPTNVCWHEGGDFFF
jgi:hypothetical protein